MAEYLYSVYPRTMITGIEGVEPFRSAKSLYLEKKDIQEHCFGKASIYRRFANEGIEVQVTGENLDRLHNEKFMTEEEYAAYAKIAPGLSNGTVSQKVVEEPKKKKAEPVKKEEPVVEVAPEVVEEEVVEEPVVETAVEEPVVKEVADEVASDDEE